MEYVNKNKINKNNHKKTEIEKKMNSQKKRKEIASKTINT